MVAEALAAAGTTLGRLDAVAATAGPGLNGGLIVGLVTAKALCLAASLPLIAVNHLEAHALTPGLTDGLAPPYLLLLVSGGHTQLLIVSGVGRYRRLGTTIDDALGEAFDKTAKLLGLGYPGGPEVERRARDGDAARFAFPRPLMGEPRPMFSFSGLKTAVRRQAEALAPLAVQDIDDICASFEAAVAETLVERVGRAMVIFREAVGPEVAPVLVVAGGVAANRRLRSALSAATLARGFRLVVPPPELCTDNAAMIAWTGAERLVRGLVDGLDAPARARWPLDPDAEPMLGAGRHGPKA
jgi:N6-L-threonylcarbamoyladenine synthase